MNGTPIPNQTLALLHLIYLNGKKFAKYKHALWCLQFLASLATFGSAYPLEKQYHIA